MTPTIFFTGFPGFLGVQLLPRVLQRMPDARAVCLVQSRFRPLAAERAAQITANDPALEGRIELVDGDITLADLGLGHARLHDLAASTVEVFHLAAVYDLTVPLDLAMAVNVAGTRHVTDFARACPDLRRYQYVSTCYVSGRWEGVFTEDDLVRPDQTFNNHYEHTKHLAEVVVREAMATHDLPTTIYRPSVVAGDADTGATQKYDGPYFVAKLLVDGSGPLVLPLVGRPDRYRFNFVPRDYVIDGIAELSGRDDTVGTCYALAEPDPPTIADMVRHFSVATGRRIITVPAPKTAVRLALRHVPGVSRIYDLPDELLDYFDHPTQYDTTNASKALAGTDIQTPPIGPYVQRIVDFVRANPTVTSAAMV